MDYVVKETLEERGHLIKGYNIAIDVLKKNEDFNPQANAIVRIHARRLRQALEVYYTAEGSTDSVRISIPKGSYVPVFEENTSEDQISGKSGGNETQQSSRSDSRPVIAILPFLNYTGTTQCEVITSVLSHDLLNSLSKFKELSLIGHHANLSIENNKKEVLNKAIQLGADYIISGSCFAKNKQVRISVEMTSTKNMKQEWAEEYFIEGSEKEYIESYPEVIRKVVSIIGGAFGLVYRNIYEHINEGQIQDYGYLSAIYWYKYYQQNFSVKAMKIALENLYEAKKKYPKNALLLAFIGQINLNLNIEHTLDNDDNLGIGTMYTIRDTDMGMWRLEQKVWQFGLKPEIGVLYDVGMNSAVKLEAKYYMGIGGSELETQSFLAISAGMVFTFF